MARRWVGRKHGPMHAPLPIRAPQTSASRGGARHAYLGCHRIESHNRNTRNVGVQLDSIV